MAANIAAVSGACYSDVGVSLAIGDKNAVEQYFDTRFDIYDQDPPPAFSGANAPAVNVRKGYLPGHKADCGRLVRRRPGQRHARILHLPLGQNRWDLTQNSPS